MKLKQKLKATRDVLAARHIEDPDIEAEVLLRHVAGLDRARFYIQLERKMSPAEIDTLDDMVERRIAGEPAAYILGHREFFGIDFKVNHSVLIPRPETELLVEKAIDLIQRYNMKIVADIGTGSGAIAVALAKHLPQCTIYAVDISDDVLEVAGTNCTSHGVSDRVHLLRGNLLEPVPEPVDLIAGNLPYVKEEDWQQLPAHIKAHEPRSALAGGKDGLSAIAELLSTAKHKLKTGAAILLEIGCDQGKAVFKLAKTNFPDALVSLHRDVAGLDRLLCIKIKESDVQTAGA